MPEPGTGSTDSEDRLQTDDRGFQDELLTAYKDQIALLRDQLEDMREQLRRRDRQIDELMRLLVGLQPEYKPMVGLPSSQKLQNMADEQLYESIELPEPYQHPRTVEALAPTPPVQTPTPETKTFSREQLSASILQLRREGKSYGEIAGDLNRIEAATLSGQPQWTAQEVRTLLPALVATNAEHLSDKDIR